MVGVSVQGQSLDASALRASSLRQANSNKSMDYGEDYKKDVDKLSKRKKLS